MNDDASLYLIFHGRFPSEKAASLFAAKSAEAFAVCGRAVTLVVPDRHTGIGENPFSYYRVRDNFSIVRTWVLDAFRVSWIPQTLMFWISYISFSVSSVVWLVRHADRSSLVYSNELLPLWFASFFFRNTYYEMHDFPESKLRLFGRMVRRIRWILIHNKWKTEQAVEKLGVSNEKIITEPNAVDLDEFAITVSRDDARAQLGIPQDRTVVLYTGHLYGWKGVDTLAEAARRLPDRFVVYFVGGTEGHVRMFRDKFSGDSRIEIVGHRPHREMPIWQVAADVCVLPNTAKEAISKYYTSPMKLFEYMTSRRPIVATRIPSIQEIARDTVVYAEPDDSDSLAEAIQRAVKGGVEVQDKIERAFSYATQHTWDERAKRILRFTDQ